MLWKIPKFHIWNSQSFRRLFASSGQRVGSQVLCTVHLNCIVIVKFILRSTNFQWFWESCTWWQHASNKWGSWCGVKGISRMVLLLGRKEENAEVKISFANLTVRSSSMKTSLRVFQISKSMINLYSLSLRSHLHHSHIFAKSFLWKSVPEKTEIYFWTASGSDFYWFLPGTKLTSYGVCGKEKKTI
jgi:hypothetical protein